MISQPSKSSSSNQVILGLFVHSLTGCGNFWSGYFSIKVMILPSSNKKFWWWKTVSMSISWHIMEAICVGTNSGFVWSSVEVDHCKTSTIVNYQFQYIDIYTYSNLKATSFAVFNLAILSWWFWTDLLKPTMIFLFSYWSIDRKSNCFNGKRNITRFGLSS